MRSVSYRFPALPPATAGSVGFTEADVVSSAGKTLMLKAIRGSGPGRDLPAVLAPSARQGRAVSTAAGFSSTVSTAAGFSSTVSTAAGYQRY
jgi:hypothetical protein